MKKSLGVMIAEHRKEKGMTQAQLAEIFGVTVDQLMQGEKSSSPINKKCRRSRY